MDAPSRAVVTVFGATIFLGAFLLFQVQLLIGKYILPWYGGVPMVWTICMLCFQALLLGGYAYTHLVVRRLPGRRQRTLHVGVMVASLVVVGVLAVGWHAPLLPDGSWKPDGDAAPTAHIVGLLAVAVGLPFLVIAPTSPLLQSWFGTAYPSSSPYRLYALSNAGSLLGLVTYPTLVEAWLPLRAQAWVWTAGFVLVIGGIAACAVATHGAADVVASRVTVTRAPRPRLSDRVFWIVLAAIPSLLLLATTNYMSQEVAAFPFLWTLPLVLYLLSFIVCFDRERWYARGPWALLLVLAITLSAFVLERGVYVRGVLQIGVPAFALFVACMVCHGELVRRKPATAHLTSFYLAITIGGAVGGAFVALVAPAAFAGVWEFPLGLWLAAAVALVAFRRDPPSPLGTHATWAGAAVAAASLAVAVYIFRESLPLKPPAIRDRWLFGVPVAIALAGVAAHTGVRRLRPAPVTGVPLRRGPGALATGVAALGLVVIAVAFGRLGYDEFRWAVDHSRSFYGMFAVEPVGETADDEAVRLRHGRITHGQQYQADDKRGEPTSYYGRDSGVGLVLEHHPRRAQGLRIGVVGLGVGTLAAYGRSRDTIRFYEINPEVIRVAGPDAAWFTYLRESAATIEVAAGDARLVLERELAGGMPQRFDVLAIDAFSSDSIPVHLLTREAVEVYLRHLDAGGVLAVHISNRYVELRPVVRGLAAHFGLMYTFVSAKDGAITWKSTWALLARNPARLAIPPIAAAADPEPADARAVMWTDDYSNVVGLFRL